MKKILFLAVCFQLGCYPIAFQVIKHAGQSQQYHCRFGGVMTYSKGNYLYLREKQVLYVDEHLFDFANIANQLLSKSFGFEPFIIKHLESEQVSFSNGISEVYVQNKISLWKELQKQNEDGVYRAYCKNFSNKKTGEIKESDIVFSPEIFFDPREAIDKAEESERINKQQLEKFYKTIDDIQDPSMRSYYQTLADIEKDSLKTYNNQLKKYKYRIEEETLITMLHEMGHALGYNHIQDDPENIMFPIIKNNKNLTESQIKAIICAFTNHFNFQTH